MRVIIKYQSPGFYSILVGSIPLSLKLCPPHFCPFPCGFPLLAINLPIRASTSIIYIYGKPYILSNDDVRSSGNGKWYHVLYGQIWCYSISTFLRVVFGEPHQPFVPLRRNGCLVYQPTLQSLRHRILPPLHFPLAFEILLTD